MTNSEKPLLTSNPNNENLVAELEAAAAKWVLEKNNYTLESLRDARRAVLKEMQPHGIETRAGAAMREAGKHVFCGATPNWIDHAGDCDALPCTCGLSEWLNSNQDLLGITLSPSQKASEERS